MKNKGLYFVIVILIVLNIIVIINNIQKDKKNYIILDSNNVWSISDKKVTKVSKASIKRMNYASAKLYGDEGSIDGYFTYDNGMKFYDKAYSNEMKLNSLIVVGNMKLKNYTNLLTTNIKDEDIKIVKSYFDINNRDFDKDEVVIQKAKINKDSVIYNIQTLSAEQIGNNGFSVVLLYKNGKYNAIYENYSTKGRKSSLSKILDINNDKNIEFIFLSDVYGSAKQECYSLYEYNENDNSYIPSIDCEGK